MSSEIRFRSSSAIRQGKTSADRFAVCRPANRLAATVLVTAGLIFAGLSGWANEPQLPFEIPTGQPPGQPGEPSADGPPVVEEPYWLETVQRALEQIESENPEVRRSAVMLLGKYPVPQAENAVVRALEDEDSGVRQAALVSLFETRRIYRGQTAVRIAERVADPDVGIRRIASNVLPMVVQGFPLSISPQHAQPVRDVPDDLRRLLLNAFRDEDATVRRNMISHYRTLYIPVPERIMEALLRDEDREVAIEALDVAARNYPSSFLARQAPGLVDRSDRLFRLNLVRALRNSGYAGAREALAALREDEDPEIALEAFVAYFRENPRPEVYEALMDALEEHPRFRSVASRAIEATILLEDEAREFLRQWMDNPDPDLRHDATRMVFLRFPDEVSEDEILNVLDEETQALRQIAFRFLRQHPRRLTPEILQAAAESGRPDVRRGAVELTRFAAGSRGEDVLRELLLDSDQGVRTAVLQETATRRIEGWERILGLSLRDRNPAIREAALRGLVRQVTPETLAELRSFLDRNPDSPLRTNIEQHLARYDEGSGS